MAVTLGQIAQHAALSRQTVSNILNNKGHLFRPETRELVFRVCQELGYKPNAIARALRSGRFHAVGLISSAEKHVGHVAPPALEGIEEALGEHGLHLVSGRFRDAQLANEPYVPKLMRELLVDGMIINYTFLRPSGILELPNKTKLPSIWMNIDQDADCVRPDDYQGGKLATAHLLAHGHRRIAYVNLLHSEDQIRGRTLHYSTLERLRGYEQTMESVGLKPRLISRPPHVSEEESARAPQDWLDDKNRPTALIFYAPAGMGTLLVELGLRGLSMPHDMSVVAFSDDTFDLYGIPVDYVMVPHAKMGRAAVEAVLRKIAEPDVKLPPEVIPCELMAAGSSVATRRAAPLQQRARVAGRR